MTFEDEMELWADLIKFKDQDIYNNYIKVMIVDDVEFMYEMLKEMLDPGKYVIIGHAVNGNDALQVYKQLIEKGIKPDVVTMDIVMPEKSGIVAIEEILQYDPDAIILVISALTPYDIKVKSLKAGARGYLTKPFNFSELQAALNKVLFD